jgi:hypothetical protein
LKLVNPNKANYITDEVIYHPRWKISFDSNLFTIMHLYCPMICLGIDFEDIYQVPVEESDQAVMSLPLLENLEFNDLPSFVSDAGSYPAIQELLLGQFSNFLEARWLIWNSFNELEVEV